MAASSTFDDVLRQNASDDWRRKAVRRSMTYKNGDDIKRIHGGEREEDSTKGYRPQF